MKIICDILRVKDRFTVNDDNVPAWQRRTQEVDPFVISCIPIGHKGICEFLAHNYNHHDPVEEMLEFTIVKKFDIMIEAEINISILPEYYQHHLLYYPKYFTFNVAMDQIWEGGQFTGRTMKKITILSRGERGYDIR